jgi:hypothetical protein
MKKQQRIALVCMGPVSRSGLSRLPGIRDQLMWVKSSTPSAASRAANVLGGSAVREYSELDAAGILLILAPDDTLTGVVEELRAEMDWRGRTAVLFESSLDCTVLKPLAAAGAHIASLNMTDALSPAVLLEGTVEARRRIRPLVGGGRHNLVELNEGGKAEYLAAVHGCTVAFMPAVAEAVDGFRRAGMEKAAAEKTAASLFENSLRAYLRAGKRLLRSTKPPASLQA